MNLMSIRIDLLPNNTRSILKCKSLVSFFRQNNMFNQIRIFIEQVVKAKFVSLRYGELRH